MFLSTLFLYLLFNVRFFTGNSSEWNNAVYDIVIIKTNECMPVLKN